MHHNVQLTKDELRRIILWLDANSLELGSYSTSDAVIAQQRNGSVIVYNPNRQPVENALYSLNGRLAFLFPSIQKEGFIFCDVQRTPLAKGVYIFRAESGNEKAAISVIKTY